LKALGARVSGLSTQDTDFQREAAERLHLPFELLSDATGVLALPIFEFGGITLTKRVTLILDDRVNEQVFYPVFPPNRNAAWML
jgi:peroxiredoxin